MRFIFSQEKRLYFFAFYSFLIAGWLSQEVISYYTGSKIKCTENYYIAEAIETTMILFSLVGLYFIYRELTERKKEIDVAGKVIDTLKIENGKLVEIQKNFLNAVNEQFKRWNLSDTEVEIATLLLRGLSNQQIAGVRNKSIKTIENQMFAIYQKSGTTGKLEFIAYFLSPLLPDED